MRSFRVFEQGFYSKCLEKKASSAGSPRFDGAEPAGEEPPHHPYHSALLEPHEISEAMGSVWSQDNMLCFGPLEDAVDRYV